MASKKKKRNSLILKSSLDFTLLITVLILLGLGIVTVLSASSPTALSKTGSSYQYFVRQSISALIGLVGMMFISKIDYKVLQKNYKVIYTICLVLLISVSFLGTSANGARRWINLGPLSFQPSEIAKIGIIIFYSAWLTKNKEKLKTFKYGFIRPLLYIVPVALTLVFLQNHLSATIIIGALAVILMLLAGCKLRYFIFIGAPVIIAALAWLLLAGQGFRMDRIESFKNPWSDLTGDGWQVVQSLYAIGSGGLFGVGLGESKQKYLYIPEPQNDFIFAVLAEELGFMGCAVVILLFAILIWRGITIAMKAPDMFGSLLASGITSMIALQVFVNIAVVTNTIPVTGMALPFFSYGGTALIIILVSMGILLSVSRACNTEIPKEEK